MKLNQRFLRIGFSLFSLCLVIVLSGCYIQEPVPTTPTPNTQAVQPADEPDEANEKQGVVAADTGGAVVVSDGRSVIAADGYGNAVVDDGMGNRVEVVAAPPAPAPRPAPGPYDTHPRVMFWPGKVNLHYDMRLGRWMTDPDGVSGAGVNILQYCRKFYPRTASYRPYREEWSNAWRDRGNVGYYESIKLSYLCVQR